MNVICFVELPIGARQCSTWITTYIGLRLMVSPKPLFMMRAVLAGCFVLMIPWVAEFLRMMRDDRISMYPAASQAPLIVLASQIDRLLPGDAAPPSPHLPLAGYAL